MPSAGLGAADQALADTFDRLHDKLEDTAEDALLHVAP
jgi:hypothetical protein